MLSNAGKFKQLMRMGCVVLIGEGRTATLRAIWFPFALRGKMPERKTYLSLFLVLCVVAATAVLFIPAAGASQPRSLEFELYPAESNMGRTNLIHDETATARPILKNKGKQIFQVLINKRTGRELFRVHVGTKESTYWVYGVVREADFNGDGIPDFSWHGGDDTSNKNLAVLSSPNGYRKVDIEATLLGEWRRRFPSDPPDKSLTDDPIFSEMKLIRRSGKLLLQGTVRYTDISHSHGASDYEHLLRVQERNFVYVK
jgi:hypothetical protein